MNDPKIGFATLPLSDAAVAQHLSDQYTRGSTVMLGRADNHGRSHLHLHKDSNGYFVRRGLRGSGKQYIELCSVTYLDGKPTLFEFSLSV